MLESIWDYVSAVIRYWQFWVAVAFMLERSLERFWPSLWKRVDQQLGYAEGRRAVFVGIAVIAFVYGNFRAFDDERRAGAAALEELSKLKVHLQEASGGPFLGIGPLERRPANPTTRGGYYLATDGGDNGYPIYWTGTVWINATGAKVP